MGAVAVTLPELSEWTLLTHSWLLLFRLISFCVKVYILQDLAFRAESENSFYTFSLLRFDNNLKLKVK